MRHPTMSPADDDDSEPVWDPTAPELLRTRSGREIPAPQPFEYLGGTRHPRMVDCAPYFAAPEPGSIRLPATIPLLGTDEGNPLARSASYGVDLTLPSRRRATHVLALGVTGSGKNVRVIDPLRASAIEDPGQTIVTFSLKATDHAPIRELCRRAGRRLVTVNLGNPDRSVRWNPLQTDVEDVAVDLIRRFAEAARNPLAHDSEFWTQWTRTAMLGCWQAGMRSFPSIMSFFSRPHSEVLARLRTHGNPHSARLADFLTGGSHNADTVMASIYGALGSLLSKSALEVMGHGELRLSTLFRRPTCLHVEITEWRLETGRALGRMLAGCVIDALIEAAEGLGRKRIPATVFCDDLPSLGAILSVDRLLTLRSRGIGIVAGAQSIASLDLAYGPTSTAMLEAFAHKIVLPGCSQPCAEYFSHTSGETTVAVPGAEGFPPTVMSRRLLSAADIRSPQHEHEILGLPATLFFGHIAFQAYLQRFHEIPRYASALRAVFHATGREKLRRRPKHPGPTPDAFDVGDARRRPTAFTDISGWSLARVTRHFCEVRDRIGWSVTQGRAREWWKGIEHVHRHRPATLVRLAEELRERQATITEYFDAFMAADTDNMQAILHYLEYARLRRASDPRIGHSPERSADDRHPGDDWRSGTDDSVDGIPF